MTSNKLVLSLLLVLVSAFSLGCSIHITSAHSVEVQNDSDKPVVILARAFVDSGKLIRSWEFPAQERILLVIDSTDVPK